MSMAATILSPAYMNSAPICEPRRHFTRVRRPAEFRIIKKLNTLGIVSAASISI
jgi:hypothetical protein